MEAFTSNKQSSSNAESGKDSDLDGVLMVRRPVMENSGEEFDEDKGEETEEDLKGTVIDAGLSKFAKRMPMFEPEKIESDSKRKLLTVNLDLALYKAKVLARSYKYEEAEKILQKVWCL